jgi:hypothetical protein
MLTSTESISISSGALTPKKTFQQMSQKESLTLAKDMIKLNQRQTGYAGMWLRPIEGSVADE